MVRNSRRTDRLLTTVAGCQLVALLALTILVAACSSYGQPAATAKSAAPAATAKSAAPAAMPTAVPAATTGQAVAEIRTDISGFRHVDVTVKAGQKVTWTNRDSAAHTVTNGTPGKPGSEFDSGNISQGKTSSHTFEKAGTFEYFCKNHTYMTARVTVQ